MVRLKEPVRWAYIDAEVSFNSIVVRLKEKKGEHHDEARFGFNSIVVRLKEIEAGCIFFVQAAFQFHSGSIKRDIRTIS